MTIWMVNWKIHPRQTFNQLKYLSRQHLSENLLKMEKIHANRYLGLIDFLAFMIIKKDTNNKNYLKLVCKLANICRMIMTYTETYPWQFQQSFVNDFEVFKYIRVTPNIRHVILLLSNGLLVVGIQIQRNSLMLHANNNIN